MVFALLLLPNRPRLDCRVSGLVSLDCNSYLKTFVGNGIKVGCLVDSHKRAAGTRVLEHSGTRAPSVVSFFFGDRSFSINNRLNHKLIYLFFFIKVRRIVSLNLFA